MLGSREQSLNLLDTVTANLMGQFDEAVPHKGRYALTIRDLGSSYATWETKTGRRIKVFRSDNGGEFCNNTIKAWCQPRGIVHEKSLPYHHEQNGSIERYNRSIADMGRTILHESGLPKEFWGFAFMWAAHLQNLLLNSRTGNRTPTELFLNQKPCYDQIRLFGETAYIHIPREKRQKLDNRVVMFLGNSKGWLFYVPQTKTFLTSAWATFPKSADMCNAIRRWLLPWTPAKKETTRKMDISFMVNGLSLGDFTKETTVESQDKLAAELLTTTVNVVTPKSFKQAVTSTEGSQWQSAIQTELDNMKDMGVYDILPLPKGTHVLGGGWVFVKKPGTGSTPARFKARYVARGNGQTESEYNQTFAPTATFTSLRLILTISGIRKWYVNSFDFVAAYLNAKIDTDIWVRPPDGLHIPTGFGCKLRKALYGTKQAGYCWWQCVASRLTTLGYTASNFDKSLYMHKSKKAMIWLHVDDGIIAAEDDALLRQLRHDLGESFKLKWEDTVSCIVGIDVQRTNDGFKLCQQQLIESIIKNAWDGTPSTKTPLPAKCSLITLPDDEEVTHAREYIGAVGALSYVATGRRPDIAYAVNLLSRHAARPGKDHWRCLQHLLGYVHHTKHLSLCLEPQHDGLQLDIFSDASWGGEFSRSTHGFLAQVNGCSVSWCAKRLVTVAASSCHAEFMALGIAARH
ncbi:hypothetical protein O181_082992, partial [Austropuccinia psidii MF-1]|nr:hypothetical protein [Austropuccinia psidii MF-1]